MPTIRANRLADREKIAGSRAVPQTAWPIKMLLCPTCTDIAPVSYSVEELTAREIDRWRGRNAKCFGCGNAILDETGAPA